jgi:NTE family protein
MLAKKLQQTWLGILTPFQILVGNSAGAINAAYLASTSDDWKKATDGLVNLWSNIQANNVFSTDMAAMAKIGVSWIKDIALGSIGKNTSAKAFLNTDPLWKLIENNIDFSSLEKNIEKGNVHQLAISATDYKSSDGTTFVQSQKPFKPWSRPQRHSEPATIQADHIMASSAIPLFFPPILVGQRFMGDGSLRNTAPLSPAVHLGADRLIAIGVRKEKSSDLNAQQELGKSPSVGRVLNTLLNAVLLDAMHADVERSQKFNRILKNIPSEKQDEMGLKAIDVLWVYPSEDIGWMAQKKASQLPRIVQYLLSGLGPLDDTAEIVSYLLFDPGFCKELVELGYRDAMADKGAAFDFFSAS